MEIDQFCVETFYTVFRYLSKQFRKTCIFSVGGMLPETPFYHRLSQLKCRYGESVVHTPGYEPCANMQTAVDLLQLRLGKVELTVSPQKSARRFVPTIGTLF